MKTPDVACLRFPEQLAALVHPLRGPVLREAQEPSSATEIASRLGLTRQRVNYHVRAMHDAGLLRRAGRRQRRGMVEQRYQATARAWVLSPELLGPNAPQASEFEDQASSATLLALASRLMGELSQARFEADAARLHLATLSLDAAFRFETPERRAAFTTDLEQALLRVVAEHTSPFEGGEGRPCRLLLGCWPIPNPPEATEPKS
ncbi:MAG: helix-turn-helix domain-containing protein [Planctomycetota bacterium]|nr:helix-turn-helix domain-containing protein [Planctomycetota bacterium]